MMMMMMQKIPASCLPSCPGLQKTIVTHPRGCLAFLWKARKLRSLFSSSHTSAVSCGGIYICHMFKQKALNFLQSNPSDHVEQLHKALLLVRVGATQNTLPPNCLKVVWREWLRNQRLNRFFFSGGWSVIRGLDERTFENSANKKGLWDECNSQTGNVKNISWDKLQV